MKNIIKLISILTFSILLIGCSTVRTVDSWKNNETVDINEKTVIVFSKTNNKMIRTQFEKDLVEHLNKKGINSFESYKMFPTIDTSKKLSEFEKQELVEKFREDGIDVVVLTVLKDTQEYTTTTTSSPRYSTYSYPRYYYNRYTGGFYVYYDTMFYESEPMNTITYEGKKYILETVTYDLTKSDDEQLVSVITTEIDNPTKLGTISKDFSRGIVKQLVK